MVFGIIAAVIAVVASAGVYYQQKKMEAQARKQANEAKAVQVSGHDSNRGLYTVYGEALVGSTIVWKKVTDKEARITQSGFTTLSAATGSSLTTNKDHKNNRWLYRAVTLCNGPVTQVTNVTIDDEGYNSPRFTNRTTKHFATSISLGPEAGQNFSALRTAYSSTFGTWGSNATGKGVAYAMERLFLDKDKPAFQGEPQTKYKVKGRKLYDPRKDSTSSVYDSSLGTSSHRADTASTWEWSDNPVLALLDYMRSEEYGRGLPLSVIDLASIATAADKCDVLVDVPQVLTNDTGSTVTYYDPETGEEYTTTINAAYPYYRANQTTTGTYANKQKRFRINIAIDPSKEILDNIQEILNVFRGNLSYANGKYLVHMADVQSSVLSLDDDDIIGGLKIANGDRSQRMNRATVKFINANKQHKTDQVSWPSLDSNEDGGLYDTYLAEDEDEKLHRTFTVKGCTDYYQAQDTAEFLVRESRSNLTVSGTFGSRCFGLVPGDVVSLDYDSAGFSGKYFRVIQTSIDLVSMNVQLQLKEYDSSVYTWNTNRGNEPLGLSWQEEVVNAAPTNLTIGSITTNTRTRADGSAAITLTIPFSDVPEGAQYVEISWAINGTNDYNTQIVFDTENQTQTEVAVERDGETYAIRARYFATNSYGTLMPSDYATTTHAVADLSGTKLDGIEDGATQNTGALADLDTVDTDQIENDAVTIAKLDTSLQSTNYSAGVSGWKLTKAGDFEAGDGTFRGAITATSGSIDSSVTIGGTAGSDVLANSLAGASVADSPQNSLLPNWQLDIEDSNGKPAGIKGVEGLSNYTASSPYVYFADSNKNSIRIDSSPDGSSSDNNVAFGWPAIPIDDWKKYTVKIRHKSESASLTGLYWRFNEHDGPPDAGTTHIAQYANSGATTARTSFNDLLANGATGGTTYVEDTYTYTPTAGTKWASFSVYNWDTYSGWIEIDYVSIQEQGYIGGVTITPTKLYQSTGSGTFNVANTGFYLDSAGQFSLKNKLSFDGTTLSVSGDVVADAFTLSSGATLTDDDDQIKNTNNNAFFRYETTAANDDVSAPNNTAFSSAFGRNPRTRDILVVVNTASNPDVSAAYVYNGSSWDAKNDFFTGDVIVDGTITADHLSVNSLSAISADMGSITSGSLNIGSGNFTVASDGTMTATGATIDGAITATSLSIPSSGVTGTLTGSNIGTLGSSNVDVDDLVENDSVALSTEPSLQLNYNAMCNLADANGKPDGLYPVEGVTTLDYITLQTENSGTANEFKFIRIDSSPAGVTTDTTVSYAWKPFLIDSSKNYKLVIRYRAESPTSSGLYLRFNEYNQPTLPSGKTHLGISSGGTNTQARTSFIDLVSNGATPPATFVEETYLYQPTSGVKLANFVLYNWSANSGYIDIDFVKVYEVNGDADGVTILADRIYQGAGNYQSSDTGFYFDKTGQFSLKDKLFYNPTNNLLTVDGSITADVITAKQNLVVLGDLEASSVAAGSITRAMLSQDALDEIFGSLATSVGGSNGDFKSGSGSFTTSGGSVTLGTSSDKFDHGVSDVEVEFNINTYFYSTTNYSTAQAQATLTFEATADGTFNDLNSADKTHTLQFLEYDLSSYYGYTYLVYYINTAITKTFTSGSGNDLADNTDVQFRVAVSGVGAAFTGQTIAFDVSANEGVTGVTSTGGNADTLDNLDSTAFLRSNVDDTFDANLTVTGNLDVTGNLNITGDINSYNVTDLDVTDKTITVNSGGTQSNSNGSGLIVDRGTAVDGYIKWDETNDRFNLSHAIFAGRTVSDQGTVSYTNNAATFSSLGVTHTDSESNVLRLMRDGTSGVVYAGLADFDLSRWESSDVASRTALSLKLGHGNLNNISSTTVPTVVTFKSDKSTEFKGLVLAEASARVEGVKGSGSGTYTWPDSMLTVRDTESLQTGVGGGIIFEGKYTTSAYTTTGSISTEKDNSTSGQYGYSTVIRIRKHGAGLAEALRLSSTKVATFAGNVDINGTTLEVGDGGTNGVIDVKATANAYFKVNGTTELTLKPSSAEFADVVMAPTGKFGTTSDNVSAIVYVKSVGSANLQRWGTGDDDNANSYRFRIDQNFKFIGNNGSTDKVVIDSATGNIDSSGDISADGIIYSGSSSGTPQIGQIRALASASAYVGATNDADKTVFMGVDSSSYGIMGTLTNHNLGFRTNNTLRWEINTDGHFTSSVAGQDIVLNGVANGSGNIVNSTNGGVFLKSTTSQGNNWIFKENAANWGIFYLNQSVGSAVGNYTTVGAEYFFTSSVSGYGPAMPSTWTGYQSGSYLNIMLSAYRGYIYAGDQIEAKNQIRTTGTFVLSGTTEIDVDDNTGVVLGAVRDADWVVRSGIGGKATGNGDTWAIGHNNTNLYFGIGNGSSANSLSTYMIVDPSRVIYMENKLTVGDETYNDGNLHVYSEGTNTDLVIDNRKTYGSGQGTADRARLIFSLSENDTTLSAQDRHFFRIEAGTISDTSSADGFAKFFVRQSGTPIEVMQFRNTGAVSISGDGSNYVAGMQRGALELGSTSRNYKYTSGWSGSMQAGILANTAENWEFAVHDAGDSVNSIFCYEGTGSNTAGTIRIGRDMGWGRNQLTIEGPILATNNGTGSADNTITLSIGKAAAGYKSMLITDHNGAGDTWFNYTDGSNYITNTGGKNYFRYYNGSTYANIATFDNSNVYLYRKTVIATDGTGSTNGAVLNVVGASYNQVNINHQSDTGWGLLIGYGDGSLTNGYHGNDTAAIINVQAAPLHLGVDNDSNMRIRADGEVEIDNRLYLEGGAYFNHTANTVTSISNADAGATNFSNRGNRLLTSNGTNWLADGRDPMFAFTENTTATTIGGAIGITMHNEQSTTNAMSPMIAFSAKSNSGNYNSAYAGILGRKIGTGVDTNWNAGELWFYAMPQGVYASDYPTMQLVPDGLNIHGSSGRNADTSVFIHGHGAYDPCIFLFNGSSSPSEGLEIWYDNSSGHSYITNKYSSGNIRFGTQTGSALKSTSNTRFEITAAGDLIFGGQDHSPYISSTNENTLNAGWNQNVDTADLWINYRGYQDGTSRFRDFRIGNGKNAELVHVDGSANRWYWSSGIIQYNWEIHADSDSASASWDDLTFQATTEWGDSSSYGVLGGTTGVMLRRPHVVWNSSAGASDIRFGRSSGVSSGTWYNLGTKASNVFFIGKEDSNILTYDGSSNWDFQSKNIVTNGTIKFQNNTSRQIAGESVNNRNTVSIYGNWDTFHVMGRVLDWSASNLHFGDGYNGVNHSSYYVQFGTSAGGTNGLNYFRVGTDIYADGNVIAYYSDARLKQKVETIPNALSIVRAIRGVYFEWNELSEKVWSRKAGEKDFGLISQEVEAVFPMGVAVQCAADKAKEMGYSDPESEHYDPLHHGDNEEEEYKTVKYDKMVAVAIQAINEQQSIIEQQQAQIDELTNLVKSLMEE